MTRSDLASTVMVTALAAAGGALLAGPIGLAVGVVIGAAAGWIAWRMGLRPVVTIVVAAGTVGGALAGDSIVAALCFPGSCSGLATTASILTGLGALVGVGLVMSLVTRSFDEYRDAASARRPPPEPGCETDESGES